MSSKKIFLVILILFILTAGSLAVYNFVLKKDGAAPAGRDQEPEPLNLLTKQISQEKAFALTHDSGQIIKYYLKQNGHVIGSNEDGSKLMPLSINDLSGLYKIIWAPDNQKVIGFFNKDGLTQIYFYDHQTKQSTLLNEGIADIAFSPDSQKIAYQYKSADGQINNISVADYNGVNWRVLYQTRTDNFNISWPVPGKIIIYDKPSGSTPGSAFAIVPSSGDAQKILSDIYGLALKFSPDGKNLIYQETDQNGKNLKLYASQPDGSEKTLLPVSTIAEKCVWSADSQNIFCAVPQIISEQEIWPDDWLQNKISTKDDFYQIDIKTKKTTKLVTSTATLSIDGQELLISAKEDYLFFVNKKNDLVYSIKLP